ncbi:MAG: GAF domain-containing protein [candidate division NC10 bacterium]|nr:GAF domain-containing protein [candidate division NC10 bacterium]
MEPHGQPQESCLRFLLAATKALVSSGGLEEILQTLVQATAALSGAAGVHLYLLDEGTQSLSVRLGVGTPSDSRLRGPVRVGEGLTGRVAATREPLAVPDCREDSPLRLPHLPQREGLVSYLGLPVRMGDRLLGVLALSAPAPRSYSADEIDRLSVFADQTAIALENARLAALAGRREAELKALLRAGRSLMAETELAAILNRIVEEAAEISGCSHVKVMLVDRGSGVLSVGALKGTARSIEDRLPLGSGHSGLVALTGEPLYCDDAPNDPRNAYAAQDRALGIVTYLGLPIKLQDEGLGVLSFNTTTPRVYTQEELSYLTAFADEAAMAIEHVRLHEAIRHHMDELERRVQERTRRLEEALKVKAEFVARMSHELRTPLNFILGYAQLLRQQIGGGLSAKQSRFVDRVYTAGNHLLGLVEDLLDLSLAESGRQRLRLERIPLAAIVRDVLELYSVQAAQKELRLDIRLDPGLELVADRGKLVQILSNLIGNAIKFSSAGGVIFLGGRQASWPAEGPDRVTPGGETAPLFTREHGVELFVEDNGVGIAAEDLERIFFGFTQVERASLATGGGAGIGLTVVRTLVTLHGGRVWAESDGLGRGACFRVRLPALPAGPTLTLVLATEDAGLRGVCGSRLREAGYVVVESGTGAEALERVTSAGPDLVILDVRAGGGEDWATPKRLRAGQTTRRPRLVVLSDGGQADRALALGADEFLSVPVEPGALLDVVRRVLAGRRRLVRPADWSKWMAGGRAP